MVESKRLELERRVNTKSKNFLSNIGLKRGTLSLASPRRGTKRKTAFLLFFASTHGLRLPRIQTYIAENSFSS